ncbi:hypothetical protein KIH86_25115 [Paenibacillus sp. HN-1]|uniref:hypothetical protein n=1 Tax=Paenibacillus TaxID=44249 RepID=UPI001CA95C97|nr:MULTISPECIES: hypothetical protein [Paenibacillus]MBY9077419.1 hypothetical protein [Paenibacillus sp. CGMCC 1.18879]MBY9087472.1 hypothetical protein [Paenibacillus sinensis]
MSRQELLDIVQNMKPADLTLYYPDGDSEAFWRAASSSEMLKEDILVIRSEGERLDALPIPELTFSLFTIFGQTGSRLEYERVYFERRRRLNTYVLLSLLEPENPAYSEKMADMLWAVCDEYTWCLPAHLPQDHGPADISRYIDLFSSETGFALSEISLLLADRLPPLLRSRIRHEVNRRLFRPFLESGPYSWETARHNWSAVCAGSIGAAALLALDDPGLLADILLKTERSADCYLEGFGSDGACLEGLGYWNYGFGYFVYYSDLLRARSGGSIDRLGDDKVRSIAQFQQKCFMGGNHVANFSDSVPRVWVHRGLSHYLSGVFPDVQRPPSSISAPYTEDHCSRWAPAFRNLIWTKGRAKGENWQAASYYLPDAAWLVSRHDSAAGHFGFAAKGGHNAEPHNHNDLGQFILLGWGEIYAADLGCGEYTADYFGAGRYNYDCNGSQGHSVPVIDGRHQEEGAENKAAVLHAAAAADRDELTLDLTKAYGAGGLTSLVRSLVWYKEEFPCLALTDEYRYDGKPSSWIERFVSWRKPELIRPGSVLLQGENGGGVRVSYDPAALGPEVTAHMYRDHFGRDTVWHSLDFHAVQPGDTGRFSFTFQFI